MRSSCTFCAGRCLSHNNWLRVVVGVIRLIRCSIGLLETEADTSFICVKSIIIIMNRNKFHDYECAVIDKYRV